MRVNLRSLLKYISRLSVLLSHLDPFHLLYVVVVFQSEREVGEGLVPERIVGVSNVRCPPLEENGFQKLVVGGGDLNQNNWSEYIGLGRDKVRHKYG